MPNSLATGSAGQNFGLSEVRPVREDAPAKPVREGKPKPVRDPNRTAASKTISRRKTRNISFMRRWLGRIPSLTVTVACLAALWIGWAARNEGHLTPEKGTGYWLGIAGGVAMLLLLLYPFRKRVAFLRYIGSVSAWFKIHMLLGLLGPILILYHANFKLGSTNSNVAMISMLTVAISGIAGRYLYGKIHLGLYGRRAAIGDVLADAESWQQTLGDDLPQAKEIQALLTAFSNDATSPRGSIGASTLVLLALPWRARRCRRQVLARANEMIAGQALQQGWSRWARGRQRSLVRGHLKQYFSAVKRAAAFAVFERLFALWHVLHLPLFILLILTATLHVIAVHTF
jgi:hypothetical protein